MAERLVNVDRQTPMLLPPDLREWVADNELAHLILEAVELCDMRGAQLNVRGSGSEQYPPSMMMALLIYTYATGVFSSRRIERASYDSVAVRYICANHHPDHDTIAKFRRGNQALFRSCFGQVLLLAREAGVLRVGALSLDGTRIAGAGSRSAVRSLEQIERELQAVGQELLEKAEAADAKDYDAEGTQLPEGLREQKQRKEKLLAAKAAIEARRQAARESGRRDRPGSGHHSKSASITEPETRCLRRGSGPVVQGYNAQAVVDAGSSGLIVGTHLSDAPNDLHELQPGVDAVAPEAGRPVAVLVDKGYDNTEQIARVEADKALLVLCRPQRRPNTMALNPRRRGHSHWKWRQRRLMEQRFLCPLLQGLYRRRQPSAEGAFARIKNHLGFRRFQVWGKSAATTEWMLVCLAHNCRMLAAAKLLKRQPRRE
jgi:transposase